MKVASRGGSPCGFQAGTELARHCLDSPCSRGDIKSIKLNSPVKGSVYGKGQHGHTSVNSASEIVSKSEKYGLSGAASQSPAKMRTTQDLLESPGDATLPADLSAWLDDMLDTSAQVPLGAGGVASSLIELKSAVDIWHLRIAFGSATGTSSSGLSRVASFEFSLTVIDDGDEEIHTWHTSVPPSPLAQSVWEAMDLRLYRAKKITIEASMPFRIAELQVFGMPLPQCPPGGFLGPNDCGIPAVQRLHSHSSLDCQGSWSEWTACQADCRRKRQEIRTSKPA